MSRMGALVIDLITYEEGALDKRETLELFGLLVKSGMAWTLQGSYGRTANELIHAGYLTPDGRVTEFADSMLEELVA
ncbi:hypothetical protein SEA_AMETHYST_67 [Streptomyces phage Amethyst]|uniref:DUF7417 domain-containing protein n=1 Tax=Streptomyces phage Amethyst TaxID=2041205 RepID=A0A291LH52_9CAUD|nr:hypothetical protein KGG83_gp67 [Streptomyces phage Amethyst]ATI18687.1 hypothetical protein SEA_AMETHYST_67 [Streptomyces phage Amethyst]